MSRARVWIVLSFLAAACGRDVATPPAPAPTAAPIAVAVASARPAEAVPLVEVAKRADGERVVVVAYLWLRRPTCPRCPLGANCEPCPPPYWQFSEKPHAEMGSDPGGVVLADFDVEPELDLKAAYELDGVIQSRSGQRVISVERILRVP